MSSAFGLNTEFINSTTGKSSMKLASLVKKGSQGISAEGITSFLTFRYPIGALTMFNDIYRVPFGYEISDTELIRVWNPSFSCNTVDIDKAINIVENLLLTAIKSLANNRSIGIVLSGGLDSALIVALTRKLFPSALIRTYTAGFTGDNEFPYARQVSSLFKTLHFEKELTFDDYLGSDSIIKNLIEYKCEPLHPNELALAYIEKQALQDGCEVILCGEGADDIFGGYGNNFRMYLGFKGANFSDFLGFFLNNYRYFSVNERSQYIRSEYLVDDVSLAKNFIEFENIPHKIEDYAIYITQRLHTPGLITRGVNAISYNNMKPGFPYINLSLVNFVNSLPFEYKVRWNNDIEWESIKDLDYKQISEVYDTPKYLLKKIAERYLPKEIIYRKKHGFPVPFDIWMNDVKTWDFNPIIFQENDISRLSGWKKFMLINLNYFIDIFSGGTL